MHDRIHGRCLQIEVERQNSYQKGLASDPRTQALTVAPEHYADGVGIHCINYQAAKCVFHSFGISLRTVVPISCLNGRLIFVTLFRGHGGGLLFGHGLKGSGRLNGRWGSSWGL